MTDPILEEALARATDTKAALIGRGVLDGSGDLLVSRFGSGPFRLVADENTWQAAGAACQASLVAAGAQVADPLIFPGRPVLHASRDNAETIRDSMGDAVPVAVGAGTLNDLVKLAAFDLGRDYACVGTAASMDGYTGSGAPMSRDGVKVTIACR